MTCRDGYSVVRTVMAGLDVTEREGSVSTSAIAPEGITRHLISSIVPAHGAVAPLPRVAPGATNI